MKIRGLLLDPPGANLPVEVCVNHQADWELIYKNPEIRMKCLVESCETLLTAKRMSKSGLRFLAVRSGGCSHNLVEMRVEHGEVAQDPSELVGGGGPEGDEHLWVKGRLFKIAQRLGAEAVVEHAPTHADVFLPEHNLVLEYQRWDTDFLRRTTQRSSAGAARTLWMFPWQPPNAPRTRALKAFNIEVFNRGGIYVAVRNKYDRRKLQRPWEDASQESTARLYASGSIAVFDPDLGALVRKQLSLATVLAQIISGDRMLAKTMVLRKSDGRELQARVWVRRDDLARVESLQAERRRAATPTNGKTSALMPNLDPERLILPENQPEGGSPAEGKTTEEHGPQPAVDVPAFETSTGSVDVAPSLPSTAARANLYPATGNAPYGIAPVNTAPPIISPSKNPPPTSRRSMWNAIANWFRRM